MAPKAPKGKNSNTGMVVTLVFFILATIGLGISTYTGYTADEGKDAKIKKVEGELVAQKKTTDWYEMQTLLLKAYIGHFKGDDLERLKVKYDAYRAGTLVGPEGGKEKPDLDQLVALLTDPKKLGWDANQYKPSKSYEQLLVNNLAEIEDLNTKLAQANDLAKRANNDATRDKTTVAALQDTYRKDLDNVKATAVKDRTMEEEDRKNVRIELDRLGKENADLRKSQEEELKKERAEIGKIKAELVVWQEKANRLTKDLALARKRGMDAPKNWRADWKIIQLDKRDSNLAYINLGSADNVQEQLTFSVHGLDLNQKPLPSSKGNVEVLNVIDRHLSQVRITDVKNRARDPIMEDDVLFNPVWDPNLKRHVAIAGLVDLTGEGRDGLQEFMRNLERMGVVVDAWTDRNALDKPKGKGISYQTDYLILADGIDYLPETANTQNLRKEIGDRILEMKKVAEEHGVQVLGFRQYLDKIGYRLPRGIDRTPIYRPTTQPVEAKEPGKEPGKEPMMPPPDKPKEPAKDPKAPPGGM